MKTAEFRKKVRSIVKENIDKIIFREQVKSVIIEEFHHLIKEESEKEGSNDNGGNNLAQKRKNVMSLLKDDKFNHAQLAYSLWHPRDSGEADTYRSLFSKKATGKPDADDAVRSFTDEEITKLYELLRNN